MARDQLESVDLYGLRAELEAALAEQTDIDAKLAELAASDAA